MVDKADNQKIVVSDRDTSTSFSLRSLKPISLIVVAIVVVIVLLYAVPVTRPIVNRYLGIATPQTIGPCSGDSKFIAAYNDVMKQAGAPGTAVLAKQAREKVAAKEDPSCVYISTIGYYGAGDAANALSEYNNLQLLKAKGKTPSTQINDGVDLKVLAKTLKATANQKPENPYGQG